MRDGKQQMIHGVRPSATLTGGRRRGIGLVCLVLATTIASPAQGEEPSASTVKFKTLVNFDQTNGASIFGLYPVQGTDGNLYGTTFFGGPTCSLNSTGCGTVFKMTPTGTLTTVYNFCSQPNCADGAGPNEGGALALGTDGNFYGTTVGAGPSASGPCAPGGCGTIFKITPNGTLITIYSFCSQPNCVDGDYDPSGVVRGADGDFYGITFGGGVNTNPMCFGPGGGCGSVFKITPAGMLTITYSFCSLSNCTDGFGPYTALVSGADGNLYGITSSGGAYGYGTVFKLTLGGKLTTLHSFDFTDGYCSFYCSPMIQATNGNFYGATASGGTNPAPGGGCCAGTVFEISPKGTFTTVYAFCAQTNCADGFDPFGLVQGIDGNFYGATQGGNGTIFKITPSGVLTTLHSFDGTDGGFPNGVAQATNGIFYGTTSQGGSHNDGTAFALSVGLPPFVELLPTSGKVGRTIQVLGSDLTGATSVNFNGTVATFTVMSKSLIFATVPTGATTGFVTVTLPGGTLRSNTRFQVRP